MGKQMGKFEIGLIAGLAGFTTGLWLSVFTGVNVTEQIKIYQREQGKPSVMRIYKSGPDGIFVENSEKKGEYIFMSNYLDRIKNEADREIERAEIKKVVKWYEE